MIIYILSIFLSAFLLFQIQPVMGKLILPWFGGTSAVWSTILLFFQTLLTGGYAYAYWLVGLRSPKKQTRLHLLVMVVSLAPLALMIFGGGSPLIPDLSWRPTNPQRPVQEILKLLFLLVGMPGFILSANSTLVQTWFTRSDRQSSPYWLYAVSNAGSLIGLVSYPILVEPNITLRIQSWIWAGGYLLFVIATGFLMVRLLGSSGEPAGQPQLQKGEGEILATRPQTQLLWVGLSAVAAILLISTTTQLTQEVAPIPLLWVLPLAIYLLTFILSFSGKSPYNRPVFTLLLVLSSVGIVVDLSVTRLNFIVQMGIYLFFLFSACMIAHGELYRLRPSPSGLSRFYLMVSIGGAFGGVFVNLIAPQIFSGYWEFHVGWILLFILLTVLTFLSPTNEIREPWRKRYGLGNVLLTVIFSFLSLYSINGYTSSALYMERNFYGVSKVVYSEFRDAYQFVNGITIHGFQIIGEDKHNLPTAYFWRDSGIAMVIRNHPNYGQQMKVGVMGLGIGTMAAHGLPGDQYRFYEINPVVIDLAQGHDEYFSFLEDSSAQITIVPGDARVSLEQELILGQRQEFDLLVMDAFSSDSVPVHLLTREAFEIYLEHLSADGVIAVNISNNYIDLIPVVWEMGQQLELEVIHISPPIQSYHPIGLRSSWIFLVQDPSTLDAPQIHANVENLDDFQTEVRLWTDDYSNLFVILRK